MADVLFIRELLPNSVCRGGPDTHAALASRTERGHSRTMRSWMYFLLCATALGGCGRHGDSAPIPESDAPKEISPLSRWSVPPASRTTFHRLENEIVAELIDPPAHVTLPARAESGFTIRERSGVEARVSLRGVADVRAAIADDAVVYRDALGRGRDVVHRVFAFGTEDFIVVDAPRSSVVYEIALGEHVAGLRLVEGAIELVDRNGTPRLRMAPPFLIGSDGMRVDATVLIEGCTVDTSPAAPWGRKPIDPGARTCAVRIAWGEVATPALLDPAWTTTGVMNEKRGGSGVALALPPSKVLLAGGYGGLSYVSTAELWDSTTGTFAKTGAMTVPRGEAAAILLSTGKVLVAGGVTAGTGIKALSTAELYDPAAGTFGATGSMTSERRNPAIAPVAWTTPAGKPVVFGGTTGEPTFIQLSTAEAYDPAGGNFFVLGSAMVNPRRAPSATVLASGAVLIAGGYSSPTAEIHTTSGAFVATAGTMTAARNFHSAVRLPDGRVFIAGGTAPLTTSTTEIYNPTTNSFTAGPPMSVARSNPPIALLPSGRVIVANETAAADVFDPVTGRFSPTGNAGIARRAPLGAFVNGKFLLAGGSDNVPNYFSTADVFAQVANGAACGGPGDCTSGFCSDGLCCDRACTGSCEACSATKKGSGSDGVCGVIADGSDPDKECAKQICVSGTQTNAFVCNGAGACRSNGTVMCSPFTCDGTGGACLSACTGDTTCVSTHWCNGGACAAKGANGAACTANRECTSGQCWDSVCCDKACGGPCEACSNAKKGSGVDGVCASVAAGTDPKNVCTQDPAYPTSCKADGFCDGAGACRTYAIKGTACGATKCEDGKVSGLTCDTGGNCLSGTTVECTPYACGTAACKTSCAADGDCSATAYCTIVSTCAAKKSNGAKCDAAKECTSGHCVDGVCCNGTCLQQCEACNEPGSEGSCVPIKGAPRTMRPACKGDPASCGGACDGIKPTECAYAPATKECGSKCSTGIEVKSNCDGAGTCAVGTPRTCGAYACDAETACKTSCTTTADCGEKYGCVDGKCLPAQSKCSDDGSKSIGFDGKETLCGSYLCDPAQGACRKECTSSTECNSGLLCNLGNKQCEPPLAAAPEESDGGCVYAARGSSSLHLAIALVAIALTLSGRRRL
jgi:hypothetical protein